MAAPALCCAQDTVRNEAWGDDNMTAQWYVDEGSTQDDIDERIERRKVYDYLHGSWQFLSALFLMQQTLYIMKATTGRIEDLDVYAGREEIWGVWQTCKDPRPPVHLPLLPATAGSSRMLRCIPRTR